jgi:Tol biopolymer transport system component
MRRFPRPLLLPLVLAALAGCSNDKPTAPPPTATGPPLLLAFVSERPPGRPGVAMTFFADLRDGGPPFLVPNANSASGNAGPCALSGDGRTLCFQNTRIFTGTLAQIGLEDVETGALSLPVRTRLLTGPANPSLSFDGRYLATNYAVGLNYTDQAIACEDLVADTLLPLPNINNPDLTNFDPSINGDGTLIAFAQGLGAYDVMLYSVPGDSMIPLPGLNTSQQELGAGISADGRYIVFTSGRPGGVGGIDVYLYDRTTSSLVPLPGFNTPFADIQPCISPDGRYIACQTEAEGGGDIRVYDVQEKKLVPLAAGVNDPIYAEQYPVLANRPATIAR